MLLRLSPDYAADDYQLSPPFRRASIAFDAAHFRHFTPPCFRLRRRHFADAAIDTAAAPFCFSLFSLAISLPIARFRHFRFRH